MRKEPQSPSRSSARDEALAWIIRLRSGEVKPADRRDFEQWLNAHPTHPAEYERAMEMWGKLDHIPPFLEAELADADQYWAQHVRQSWARATTGIWDWRQAFAGMSVAVVVMVIGLLVWQWPGSPIQHATYRTAKGEQRNVTLTDGSTILMNTDSQVSVRLSHEIRLVDLHRGEALFTVAHEPERPFDVYAANGIIHDIGTEFLVRQSLAKVQVAVLEGRVAVEAPAQTPTALVMHPQSLREGEEVYYTTDGELSTVTPFDVQTTAAWRHGQLVFVETPLEEVLHEWARYRSDVIRLRDPSLGRVPFSGAFRLDNIEGFFRALEDLLALHPVRQGPKTLVLERKAKT